MGVSKRIKPILWFSRMPDDDLIFLCVAVIKGMTGNPAYPRPPIDLADLSAALDRFVAARAALLDGGRKATVERDRCRVEVTKMMRQLGLYVEDTCQNDMATFVTSGFVPVPPRFGSA